jgi:hypothetical protein
MHEEYKTGLDFTENNNFNEDCLGEDDPENAIAAAVTANNVKQIDYKN